MIKTLPIGIDDFEKLITNDYYYVDKTWMIKELWDRKGDVNLFTRPRRFGKTLNMSMLRYFFEISERNAEAVLCEANEIYLKDCKLWKLVRIIWHSRNSFR